MPGSISRREAKTWRASSGDGIGNKGATVAFGAHQPLKGQHLQRDAGDGAADVEEIADLGFGQLGSGRKAAIDNGVAQLVANRLTLDPLPRGRAHAPPRSRCGPSERSFFFSAINE